MTDSATTFGKILKRARALERLNRRVCALLDADLARHCQVANLREGQLIFACDSASCATRLRMESSRLLEQLHAMGFEETEEIVVKMTPSAGAG